MTKTIKGEEANLLMCGYRPNGWEELARQWDDDIRRWYTSWHVVFRIPGDFGIYRLDYSEPKTAEGEIEWERWKTDEDVPVQRVKPEIVQVIRFVDAEDQH